MSTEDQWEGLLESKQDCPVLWRDRVPWKPGQTRGETSEAQGGRDRSRGQRQGLAPFESLKWKEQEGQGGPLRAPRPAVSSSGPWRTLWARAGMALFMREQGRA